MIQQGQVPNPQRRPEGEAAVRVVGADRGDRRSARTGVRADGDLEICFEEGVSLEISRLLVSPRRSMRISDGGSRLGSGASSTR